MLKTKNHIRTLIDSKYGCECVKTTHTHTYVDSIIKYKKMNAKKVKILWYQKKKNTTNTFIILVHIIITRQDNVRDTINEIRLKNTEAFGVLERRSNQPIHWLIFFLCKRKN